MEISVSDKEKDIILSIGMIVKNEEKVLERCLKSLKPIMEAIPSELIIADTGSTDSTVEIARKYTDNVYSFEWINDFAAARNYTIDHARGQWYLYIDADEYFDADISEIIKFFSVKRNLTEYRSCAVKHRNYTNKDKTDYKEFAVTRFYRILDNGKKIRFQGCIHEVIPLMPPTTMISAIMYHTGYCFESEQIKREKYKRNLELLKKEYDKEPENLRTIAHLIDSSFFEPENKFKYINEGVIIARRNIEAPYANILYVEAVRNYYNKDGYRALQLINEYFSLHKDQNENISTMSIHYLWMSLLFLMKKYDEVCIEFKKYKKLYNDYKNNALDVTDLLYHELPGVVESDYIRANYFAAVSLFELSRCEDVISIIEQFDINTLEDEFFGYSLGLAKDFALMKKNYDLIVNYYKKISLNGSEKRKKSVLTTLETVYSKISDEMSRIAFSKLICDSGIDDCFSELMKITSSQGQYEHKDIIKSFIRHIDEWQGNYYEAVYFALKSLIDIGEAADKMPPVLYKNLLCSAANIHEDFSKAVLEYGTPEEYFTSIKRFSFLVTLNEIAVYCSFRLDDNNRYALCLRFVNLLGDYISNIYNPELLEDEADTEVLPELHRFGYYMQRANRELENGDATAYIKEMRKALESCESMREIVEFMLDQFKKMMKMS